MRDLMLKCVLKIKIPYYLFLISHQRGKIHPTNFPKIQQKHEYTKLLGLKQSGCKYVSNKSD